MTWYVMRDLTRANVKEPAWKRLSEEGFRVFTPLAWRVRKRGNHSERYRAAIIHDLLFVDSTREQLDPVVERIPTLQYRFVRGGYFGQAMEIDQEEMERFILAVESADNPLFFSPEELTPSMIGKEVEIVGGPLNGFKGHLLSVRGMRKKRLIINLEGALSTAVDVAPDYIRFV